MYSKGPMRMRDQKRYMRDNELINSMRRGIVYIQTVITSAGCLKV